MNLTLSDAAEDGCIVNNLAHIVHLKFTGDYIIKKYFLSRTLITQVTFTFTQCSNHIGTIWHILGVLNQALFYSLTLSCWAAGKNIFA